MTNYRFSLREEQFACEVHTLLGHPSERDLLFESYHHIVYFVAL